MSDICIVGNGIIGLQTAYALLTRDHNVTVTLLGPSTRRGCASLAAAAMFNSFCEVDAGTFGNEVELTRFKFNMLSNNRWPVLLPVLAKEAGCTISSGFGTYLINNTGSDGLEDENFDAIVSALTKHAESFEWINPKDIPFYKPEARHRATRSVYIPNEGWVNPRELIAALERILRNSRRVTFVEEMCLSVKRSADQVTEAVAERSGSIVADKFILCPGASFTKLIEASNLDLSFQRIFYGVGATILLRTEESTITHCIRTPNRGLACGLYAAPQSSRDTLIGASNFISMEPVDFPRTTSVYTLLKSAMEQLNRDYYRSELVRVNLGWRPTSADTLPLLGRTSIGNLFVATGTKRDGLHCSPVIAQFLADLVLSGQTDFNFELFKPERKPVKFLRRDEAIEILVRHSINAAYQHDFVPAKSRMVDELEKNYRDEFCRLHDEIGAYDWGIPAEMKDMYKYGHLK